MKFTYNVIAIGTPFLDQVENLQDQNKNCSDQNKTCEMLIRSCIIHWRYSRTLEALQYHGASPLCDLATLQSAMRYKRYTDEQRHRILGTCQGHSGALCVTGHTAPCAEETVLRSIQTPSERQFTKPWPQGLLLVASKINPLVTRNLYTKRRIECRNLRRSSLPFVLVHETM
ncbi:unnamed protein product [Phytophthora fragariaefolia]|uniref:Unnamed protein product n=1 Tax=Phytophthora fragariaefolia TaxID=1490495 RepID=A0A9W6YQZ5_9STRA|nr:unnamed protein product [Phytophthora fragariaefolia]